MKLDFMDAITPKKCLDSSNIKRYIDDIRKLIKWKLSSDQILKLNLQVENLKLFCLFKIN